MNRIEIFRDLFRHMEWADATAWAAVLAHPAAATDERIRTLFHHLHTAQHAFHRAWTGVPREAPYPEFRGTSPIMEWAKAWYPAAHAWMDAVEPEHVPEKLNLPWAPLIERRLGRPAADSTLGDTILQVAMHSQYHRAQIIARLRELGGEPPTTDYIAWIWYGKPGPTWPRGGDQPSA